MKLSFAALFALSSLSCSLVLAQGGTGGGPTTVLDHNFQNGAPGDLSAAGEMGTPVAGTLSATGGFVSTARPAWTSGNNGSANVVATIPDGSFNELGPQAGNVLTATLSEPAAVSGGLQTGETTTISFNLASFGTNNPTFFKYAHVIGLSSTGDEVF